MTRAELKALAKQNMKGNIATAFLIAIITAVITGAVSMLTSFISFITIPLICGPFALGSAIFYLHLASGEAGRVSNLFEGFKSFLASFLLYLLRTIFIALWSLLFCIPGLMKTYSYAMAFYIMADNPGISANDAITKSKEMMKGHRMELFVLQLSFFGWFMLCGITFGLAFIYVGPYMQTTIALFYKHVVCGDAQPTSQSLVHSTNYGYGGEQVPYAVPMKEETPAYNTNTSPYQASMNETVIPESGATVVLTPTANAQTTVLSATLSLGVFTGLGGSLAGLSYAMTSGEVYAIGRDSENCGIVISAENASVSRIHCTIQFAGTENGYYVTDMSSNGTFVNGVRMQKGQQQFVPHGTTISLGDQVNSFRLD